MGLLPYLVETKKPSKKYFFQKMILRHWQKNYGI